jgi:TolA-binding protein
MKTISVWICLLTLTVAFTPCARAQDAATQAQLDKITGDIQDVKDSLNSQDKRISDLEKKISDMQEKLNTPAGNDFASADDLKKLAEQVQEIDKKRQQDNQKILDALEKLGNGKGGSFRRPAPDNPVNVNPGPAENTPPSTSNNGGPQNGYEYTIAPGNNLTAIVKAYRAQGVKVTVDEILKANPGLDSKHLIVGKKIFIPAPQ